MNTKICTDIEQSEKLIEFGIDVNTADMCHRFRWSNDSFILLPCAEKAREPITDDIPAWSLSALLKLMPFQIMRNKLRYSISFWKGHNREGDTYCYEYISKYLSNKELKLFKTKHRNNPVDAAFEMILKLHELNLL